MEGAGFRGKQYMQNTSSAAGMLSMFALKKPGFQQAIEVLMSNTAPQIVLQSHDLYGPAGETVSYWEMFVRRVP